MSELEQGAVAETAAPLDVAPQSEPVSAPAAEAPVETAPPDIDTDLRAVWDKLNPTLERDESGRFRSTNPAASEPPEAQAAPSTEGQSPEPAASETATPSIAAPNSWPAEMKAKWSALPPDAQEYISRREGEAHAQITRMGQQVKAIEPVNRVLEQNRDVFERVGLSYDQGVNALLQAQRALETNPVAAIQQLANQFGVDLGQLYGNGSVQSQPANVLALEARIAALQNQLAETSNRVMTREQRDREEAEAKVAAEQAQIEAVYHDFTKANPDFLQIEDHVVALIPAIKAANPGFSKKELLAEAYEQAKWANPALRAQQKEAERKALQDKAKEEAAKKAADAKRSAAVNVRTGQSASSAEVSNDEALRSVWAKHHGSSF